MKKIEAIIRPEKLAEIMDALKKLGYPGMTLTEIRGHGKQKGITQLWRGEEYKIELLPKIKLEIVVLDDDVSRIIEAIRLSARTGEMGDGKIFVLPIEDAVRVRTGEGGENAI